MPDNFTGMNFDGIIDFWPANQYPVMAKDLEGMEGAHKRFVPLPTVQDLRKIALIGLQRIAKEAYNDITDEYLEHFLTATMSEIESKYYCALSPTEFFQSYDYQEGMFTDNYGSLAMRWWPAFACLSVKFKFAHTQSSEPVQEYEIPPQWIALRHNKINILADFGTIAVTHRSTDGGMYGNLFGFLRGPYRPAAVEVHYKAGFTEDRIPAVLSDWILTLASIRVLGDISPIIFPFTSVSATIDGVTQSQGMVGPQFLMSRIQLLTTKEKQLRSAVMGHFGRNIKLEVINSGG